MEKGSWMSSVGTTIIALFLEGRHMCLEGINTFWFSLDLNSPTKW